MLDSDFWRELAEQFRSTKDCADVHVNWADKPGGSDFESWEFAAPGTNFHSARVDFETLARRAGAKIEPEQGDSFTAWLSRLKREGRKDLVKVGATYPWGDVTRGQIQNVCTVSADYCKVLESRALSAEQENNRRNVPAISKPQGRIRERPSEHSVGEAQDRDSQNASQADPSGNEAGQTAGQTQFDHRVARRAAVDGFLLKVKRETNLRVCKKHIWKAAGHITPRQFQYWQAGEDRLPGESRGANNRDDVNFRRILAMEPDDFVTLLRSKHAI